MLLQVVSGHGLFGSHLKKWNPNIDATCQCCLEEDETSWHLWKECVALERLRGEVDGMGLESMEDRVVAFFGAEQLREVWLSRNEYLKERDRNK